QSHRLKLDMTTETLQTPPPSPPRSDSVTEAPSSETVPTLKKDSRNDAESKDPSSHNISGPSNVNPDCSGSSDAAGKTAGDTVEPEEQAQSTRSFPEMTLSNDCPHVPAAGSAAVFGHIRLVHWPTKTIRVFCGVECPELAAGGWRVIAVSHVWGQTRLHSIQGVPWTVPIADNKSLEAAFEGADPRDLHWLDILSIDQQSNEELMYSTKEMSLVFARAEAVRLWLPDTTVPWPLLGTLEPSEDAMTAMIRREAGDTNLNPEAFLELRVNPEDLDPISLMTLVRWIHDAYTDEWFTRVWTTQEMALARTFIFGGREFHFRCIQGWHKILCIAHTLVPKEVIERLPLTELEELQWRPCADSRFNHHVVYSWNIEWPLELRDSVQSSSTGCSLGQINLAMMTRECKYLRDKVLTMPPLLKCDLALPDFSLDDDSEELLEWLWYHAVVRKMADGDISIVYEIAPNHINRKHGLWHRTIIRDWDACRGKAPPDPPVIDPAPLIIGAPAPGLARVQAIFLETPVTDAAWFTDELPYDFWRPTQPSTTSDPHPAILRNVHFVTCDAVWKRTFISEWTGEWFDDDVLPTAYNRLSASESEVKRSEKMFTRLNTEGLPSPFDHMNSPSFGLARIGGFLAPFWMNNTFTPDPNNNQTPWRTLQIMVVVPARPRFKDEGRMRCWVVGGNGDAVPKVPNSRINEYPGPYGAVWIDWHMVEEELELKNRVPVDLTIP
ncbi:hypothetical protein HDU96_009190, partial [Phlyctochytrium bullatum]